MHRGMNVGRGKVETNSLHPEDRYDTSRKYSAGPEIDTSVNLLLSPFAALSEVPRETVGEKRATSFFIVILKSWWQNLRNAQHQISILY